MNLRAFTFLECFGVAVPAALPCISTHYRHIFRTAFWPYVTGAHDLGLGLWMPDLFPRHTPVWDPPPYRQKWSSSNP